MDGFLYGLPAGSQGQSPKDYIHMVFLLMPSWSSWICTCLIHTIHVRSSYVHWHHKPQTHIYIYFYLFISSMTPFLIDVPITYHINPYNFPIYAWFPHYVPKISHPYSHWPAFRSSWTLDIKPGRSTRDWRSSFGLHRKHKRRLRGYIRPRHECWIILFNPPVS